ncbi:hypothetical protein LguiB_022882 [Lonicera macranthoides]
MITRNINSRKREFISTPTGDKYNIDLVEFFSARTLFSKQGWLLLDDLAVYKESRDPSYLDVDFGPSIFLFNPFTKTKIELPSIGAEEPTFVRTKLICGAFTMVEGMPDLVVIARAHAFEHLDLDLCPTINVWTIHPGDNEWNMHSYTRFQPCTFFSIFRVLIVGQLVYCFNDYFGAIVLNLSNSRWTDNMQQVDKVPSEYFVSYCIAERKGEIYKCYQESGGCSKLFYKLNADWTAWEPLKVKDLKGKCWFLNGPVCSSFLFEQEWRDEVCRELEGNWYDSGHLHDARMMARKFLLELSETDSVEWVDMG